MTTLAMPTTTLLRRALQGNSLFSAMSGLTLLIGANAVSVFTGIESAAILTGLGVVLLLFAADLFWMTRETAVNPTFARLIIALDILWVVGSVLILFTNWVPLTNAGWWSVAIVADIVAVFAILQYIGLRRVTA